MRDGWFVGGDSRAWGETRVYLRPKKSDAAVVQGIGPTSRRSPSRPGPFVNCGALVQPEHRLADVVLAELAVRRRCLPEAVLSF